MRHYGHQSYRLMSGRLINLQRIDKPPMVVPRISHAADDGDSDALNTDTTVQTIYSAD